MCKKNKEDNKKQEENGISINKGLLIFCLVLLAIIIALAIAIPRIK